MSDVRRVTVVDDAVANRSLDPKRFLPMRLSRLGNRLTRAVARVYADSSQLSAPEWRATRREANAILSELADAAKSAGVICETVHVEQGQPYESITETAQVNNRDLIVRARKSDASRAC